MKKVKLLTLGIIDLKSFTFTQQSKFARFIVNRFELSQTKSNKLYDEIVSDLFEPKKIPKERVISQIIGNIFLISAGLLTGYMIWSVTMGGS